MLHQKQQNTKTTTSFQGHGQGTAHLLFSASSSHHYHTILIQHPPCSTFHVRSHAPMPKSSTSVGRSSRRRFISMLSLSYFVLISITNSNLLHVYNISDWLMRSAEWHCSAPWPCHVSSMYTLFVSNIQWHWSNKRHNTYTVYSMYSIHYIRHWHWAQGPYAWSTNSDVNGTIALTYR